MGMDAWLTLALSAEIDLDALIVAVIKAAKELKLLDEIYDDIEPQEIFEDDPGSFGALLSKTYEARVGKSTTTNAPAAAGKKTKRTLPGSAFEIRKSSDGNSSFAKKTYLCLSRYDGEEGEQSTWSRNEEPSSLVVPAVDPKQVDFMKRVVESFGVKLRTEPAIVAFVHYS